MRGFGLFVTLAVLCGTASAQWHTIDTAAPHGIVSLSELLRAIQFYNSPGFHCEDGAEDGYAPGSGDQTCAPHDLDYNPQNWVISLSELLRAIQFYNSTSYYPCSAQDSEDGYCSGEPSEGEGEGEGEGEAPTINAAFWNAVSGGNFPLPVAFTDLSTTSIGAIETWAWDFGDGDVSAEPNPTHVYELPGFYTPILTVTSPAGRDTEFAAAPIVINLPDGTIPSDPAGGLPIPRAASVSGTVTLGGGKSLNKGTTQLRLRSIGGTADIALDGTFAALPCTEEGLSQLLFLEDENGALLGAAYLPPLSPAKSTGISLDATSFALGLIRMNPYMVVLDPGEEQLVLDTVIGHPDFPAFLASVVSLMSDPAFDGLDLYETPELFAEALRIGFETMDTIDLSEGEGAKARSGLKAEDNILLPTILDAPGSAVTLSNPLLCFYGVDFGNGQRALVRGPKKAIQYALPEVWSQPWILPLVPPYKRNVDLEDGTFDVTFYKGLSKSVPGWNDIDTAQGLASYANGIKIVLLFLKYTTGFSTPLGDNEIERFLSVAASPNFDLGELADALDAKKDFNVLMKAAKIVLRDHWDDMRYWLFQEFASGPPGSNGFLGLDQDTVRGFLAQYGALADTFGAAMDFLGTYVSLPLAVSNQIIPFGNDLIFGPQIVRQQFVHQNYVLLDLVLIAPPNAFFSVDEPNPGPGASVTFDASASSTVPPGGTLEYRWDFDGDGLWNTDWAAGSTSTYAYSRAGTYRPRLQVRDATDLTSIYARNLPVGELEEVLPPVINPDEFVYVPAGSFDMGRPYTDTGSSNELPVHTVYLDAYAIGKYEVTNQQMADVLNWAYDQGYLDSSGGAHTGGRIYAHGQPLVETYASSRYSSLEFSGGEFTVRSRAGIGGSYSMADHPVVLVSWFGSVAYCNWRSAMEGLDPAYNTSAWSRYSPVRNGYRLPTEAEWERAAAWDGDRHWRYGFTSDTISTARANYYTGSYANPLGLTASPYTSPLGWFNGVNISPKGMVQTQYSVSPVGAFDMSGNVWEWCGDWYASGYYATSPGSNPEGPATGSSRVLRGGGWLSNDVDTRAAARGSSAPGNRSNLLGLRVSRTP